MTSPEDREFDEIFPVPMQRLSARHWTPGARRAGSLLVQSAATTVLDMPGCFRHVVSKPCGTGRLDMFARRGDA